MSRCNKQAAEYCLIWRMEGFREPARPFSHKVRKMIP